MIQVTKICLLDQSAPREAAVSLGVLAVGLGLLARGGDKQYQHVIRRVVGRREFVHGRP